MMADHGAAVGAVIGPIAASKILVPGCPWGKGSTMGVRARENVVLVSRPLRPDATVHHFALFSQRRLSKDQIAVSLDITMQIGEAGGNQDAFGIVPGPVTNPVARIDGRLRGRAIRAQISAPGAIARSHFRGQTLANGIGAGESAEIAAMRFAGNKEGHRCICLRHRQHRG